MHHFRRVFEFQGLMIIAGLATLPGFAVHWHFGYQHQLTIISWALTAALFFLVGTVRVFRKPVQRLFSSLSGLQIKCVAWAFTFLISFLLMDAIFEIQPPYNFLMLAPFLAAALLFIIGMILSFFGKEPSLRQ